MRGMLVAFALGVALRIGAAELSRNTDYLHSDPSEYLTLGKNLRSHGAFSFGAPHKWGEDGRIWTEGPFTPVLSRAPLYPLIIAGLWNGTAIPVRAIRIFQAILGASVVFPIWSMLKTFSGARSALCGALLVAAWPLSVHLAGHIMSETIFTALVTFATWFWSRGWSAATGVTLGLATLTRPVGLMLLIAIGMLAVVRRPDRALHLRISAIAILVIMPWVFRNYLISHRLVPVAAQGVGSNLLFGTIRASHGDDPWAVRLQDSGVSRIISESADETSAERLMMSATRSRIAADPIGWILTRLRDFPNALWDRGSYFYRFVPAPRWLITAVSGSLLLGLFAGSA